jgi:MFS transporter, DHA1 family, multidrug resistance protein
LHIPKKRLSIQLRLHRKHLSSMAETLEKPDKRDSGITTDEGETKNLYENDLEAEAVNLSQLSSQSSTGPPIEPNVITRVLTRLSRRQTKQIPLMGGGRDYPPPLPDRDPYRVDFDGPDDPIHPYNWPFKQKAIIVAALGFSTLTVVWGSAVFSNAIPFVCEEFHVSSEVGVLTISLYVLGFASGPVMWAPISELYGRKLPIVLSMLGVTVFSFGTATAKDLQTIMLTRFFCGFIGAGPVAVVAAAFADMFNNETRGKAIATFSLMVFCGPILAPVVGGFIAYSYLGWRWTEYITGIMGALSLIASIFLYEESYHPIILVNKARELRRQTGNWGIYASHELIEFNGSELITNNLSRPIAMLFSEPILFLMSLYSAFIYGILYTFLEAYPIVFEGYNFKKGIVELPYIGMFIGMVGSAGTIILFFEPKYIEKVKENGWRPVPEARLPPMMLGAVLFPIGVFWFTWSGNYPDKVHWAVPTVSGLFSGFGFVSIFLPSMNYVIDSYLKFAASAMAANTFLRSSFGAAFPLFASIMFHNLGINWAGTLIGCIAILLVPIPFLFAKFGKSLRRRSKFAFDLS